MTDEQNKGLSYISSRIDPEIKLKFYATKPKGTKAQELWEAAVRMWLKAPVKERQKYLMR